MPTTAAVISLPRKVNRELVEGNARRSAQVQTAQMRLVIIIHPYNHLRNNYLPKLWSFSIKKASQLLTPH